MKNESHLNLFEFFLIQSIDGYLLDCDSKATNEIISYLTKYKLRSKIEIKDQSSKYIIGIISLEKFEEIQKSENKDTDTFEYRNSSIFIDARNKKLGARILSTLEKLHLTIKKLGLKMWNVPRGTFRCFSMSMNFDTILRR